MAYFSPVYAPHFERYLPATDPSPYDPNGFIIPERRHILPRAPRGITWNALTDASTAIAETQCEQAYRAFHSDCYSTDTVSSMPLSPGNQLDWLPTVPPQERRGRSRVTLILGRLCPALLALLVFAACCMVRDMPVGWVFTWFSKAGHWGLRVSRSTARKALVASRLGIQRACNMLSAAASRALNLFMGAVCWAFGPATELVSWVHMAVMRAYWTLPYSGLSLEWFVPVCAALWALLELKQQEANREDGPMYVLVDRYQSHGSGPWSST